MLLYVYINRDLIYNLIFLGARVIIAARNDEKGQDAVRRIKSEIGADLIGAKLIEFMKLDLSSFAEGIFLIN
jgi:NAD(P)-dependent dehydrogenase (short-subunit alcohol dehydrogenase family)